MLKEIKNAHAKVKPGWQIQLEQQTSSYRRRLAFVDLILKCKKEGKYTKHQRNIERKLKRWYKKTTTRNLTQVRTVLKEKLGATAEKRRRRKVVREHSGITSGEKRNNLIKKPIGFRDLRKSTLYEYTTSKA